MSDRKAYLMTQDQYLKEVVPVLKEYKTFLKKNNYFIKMEYGGMKYISYPELEVAAERKENLGYPFDFSDSEENKYSGPVERRLREGWLYRSRGYKAMPEKEPSPAIIEKNKEYQNTLIDLYGKEFFDRALDESDNIKSNKRVIRYAIDHNVYKDLIATGKADVRNLETYAASSGVKLPKKLYEGTEAKMEDFYKEVYAAMPSVNKEILTKLVDDLIESFKPLSEVIYKKEFERYDSLIDIYVQRPDIRASIVSGNIPFYDKIFSFKSETRYEDLVTIYYFTPVALLINDMQTVDIW